MLTDYVVFDTETTGLDAHKNEIIEIGAFKVENGVVVARFCSFCRPKAGIPYFITKINGITNEMVADAEPSEVVIPEFKAFCGDLPLMGYNLPFDFRFINAVEDFTTPNERYGFDVLPMTRQILGSKTPNHKLGTVAEYLNIKLWLAENNDHNRNLHSALFDAMLTKRVYEELCKVSKTEYNVEKLTNDNKDTSEKGEQQNVQTLSYI